MKGIRDSGFGIRDLGLRPNCECGQAGCTQCAEVAALAKRLRDDFEQTTRQARVPTPEIVWWRAQMRARQEATRAAARPILFTQALAIAALAGLVISVAGRITLPIFSWTALMPIRESLPLLPIAIVAGCWLLIAPLALYFVFSRD